jgi:hypothetical protein
VIENLFNSPLLVHQTATDGDWPSDPVAIYRDHGGSIILSQRGSDIILDDATVPDFIKALKQIAKSATDSPQ